MKDLIRSPLQFIQPMTDDEWQDLVSRAGHREEQRIKRHQPRTRVHQLETTRRRRNPPLTAPAASTLV